MILEKCLRTDYEFSRLSFLYPEDMSCIDTAQEPVAEDRQACGQARPDDQGPRQSRSDSCEQDLR